MRKADIDSAVLEAAVGNVLELEFAINVSVASKHVILDSPETNVVEEEVVFVQEWDSGVEFVAVEHMVIVAVVLVDMAVVGLEQYLVVSFVGEMALERLQL